MEFYQDFYLVKLQVACLVLVLYVTFMHFYEKKLFVGRPDWTAFETLLMVSIVTLLFDGLSVYSINNLATVGTFANKILHVGFMLSINALAFSIFWYIASLLGVQAQLHKWKLWLCLPLVVGMLVVFFNAPSISYMFGAVTNYVSGAAVNTCYSTCLVYVVLLVAVLYRRFHFIDAWRQFGILAYLLVITAILLFQRVFPEILLSSLVPTFVVLGAYMNRETPEHARLKSLHEDMVMGFASLVESRDHSTGGHIRRTSFYVKALAEGLRNHGRYTERLTPTYITNLVQAAPLHDVGKIAIADAILQKPGRLTDEEYAVMKTHTTQGAKIVINTFGHTTDREYQQIAWQVALYHHEKWNGRGYPEGLAGEKIPLSARIMAVADVFDAVSAKRCYRDELPLDVCFEIIEKGRGTDFDPVIVDTFLAMRPEIEKIHRTYKEKV